MAEGYKETWIQWVALTTTILAVCASLSTLKGGGNSTKVQLLTTQEANRWSHYQSKSIKQTLRETGKELLEVQRAETMDKEAIGLIDKKLDKVKAEIDRYSKEKDEIKKDAESLSAQQDYYKRKGGNFGLATMLLQIAIMLSGVGGLLKKKIMWYFGMALGLAGIVFMMNGFLLLLPLLI